MKLNIEATKLMPMSGSMTNLNHLGSALFAKPEMFEGVLDQLFITQTLSVHPFLNMSVGHEKIVESNEWEYKVRGAKTRPLILLETVSGTGAYGQILEMKFDEEFWMEGDVITAGDQFHDTQCRIMKNPYRSGNGWIYEAQLVSKDQTQTIDARFLQAGTPWAKLYSTYGEAADKGGSSAFPGSLALKGHLGKLRKTYKITDYAAEQKIIAMRLKDETGKSYDRWIPFAEAEAASKFKDEKEIACWFNHDGYLMQDNGYPVDSFPGIIAQIRENGWKMPYTTLSAKMIESFVQDIFFGRREPVFGKRELVAFTGSEGLMKFNKLLQSEYGKNGWMIANPDFNPAQKTSSPQHPNAYSYGYQFTEYKMGNGGHIKLVYNPLFDSMEYNLDLDPVTKRPKASSMFVFFDVESNNGLGNNVQLVVKRNGYKHGYHQGLVGPTGPAQGGMIAHPGEYYSAEFSSEFGIQIIDPTRTGLIYMQ